MRLQKGFELICFLLLFRFTRCQMLLDRVKRTPLTSADYFKARGGGRSKENGAKVLVPVFEFSVEGLVSYPK